MIGWWLWWTAVGRNNSCLQIPLRLPGWELLRQFPLLFSYLFSELSIHWLSIKYHVHTWQFSCHDICQIWIRFNGFNLYRSRSIESYMYMLRLNHRHCGRMVDLMPVKYPLKHDYVIKWKHFPRNWPSVRKIHRSPVNSPTKASDAELWCFLWYAHEQTFE